MVRGPIKGQRGSQKSSKAAPKMVPGGVKNWSEEVQNMVSRVPRNGPRGPKNGPKWSQKWSKFVLFFYFFYPPHPQPISGNPTPTQNWKMIGVRFLQLFTLSNHRMEIRMYHLPTYGQTDTRTWVGARDTCVSKNVWKLSIIS